jgi:Protein of unknown function (DUF4232)
MPEQHRMRLCAAMVSASLGLALAACGGSGSLAASSSTQDAPTTSTSSTPASTTTTAPATTTTVVTTTVSATTTANSPPACVADDLALSYLGQEGATGHGELGFSLRNTSSSTCHTYGYPGVLFLDQSGAALPTESTRTTHDFFGSAPEVPLLLTPGSSVSFRLGVTHGVTSNAQCATAYGLQVIPPDDTNTLVTKIPGGAYECRTATVSPLRPGNSAFP